MDVDFVLRELVNGIILGSTYSLAALGLTLVFGVMRVINLAQGEFLMAGAFAGLVCLQAGFGFPAALLAGVGCATLLGVATYWLALRPLPSGVDPHVPMIGTIAAAVIVQQVATRLFTARQQPFPTPAMLAGRMQLGPLDFEILDALILGAALSSMAALYVLILHTRLGLAIRAVAENPRIASLMGISRGATTGIVFAISSALAGIAGVLLAMHFNNVSPYLGVPVGMKGLAAVILGGLGNVPGALVAGFVIGLAEVTSVMFVDSSWRDAVAFVVMIVILLVRPSGLFGKPPVERV